MRSEKVETLCGRFRRNEAVVIEAAAKREGVTVSEYMRSAALVAAVMQGNVDAIKLAGAYAVERMVKFVKLSPHYDPAKRLPI
jgi:uncharacterized protein (DUF1778 family)